MPTESKKRDAATGGTGSPEERERAAATERGEARERARVAGESPRSPEEGPRQLGVEARAFVALAENVRDYAIFLMDPEGIITFWGEGARLIKWWSKDAAEGAHLRMLYPSGGSNDGTAEEHLRLAAERGEYTGEGERVRSDGSTFWAGVTLTALWDDDGTLLGFAKVTRDVTARRAADALLKAAAASAEAARADAVAASTAKSGFLASMSHEIRTPVNAVMGYLELLQLETDGPLTPVQRQHLARAGASARHLLELITEVLDFSRIEADRVAISRSAFRVGNVVASALELVVPQARAHGIEISDAVSGYAAGLAAWGDEARARQILVNLLANAVKFTAPRSGRGGGSDPGRVTVSVGTATQASPDARLGDAGPWVYVRIEDTGIGIPAERLQPIFDAFVQADMTLTREHGGAGLGLAISRRLARLMGGDVTVRSEVGMGSTFFLWLPAAAVESLESGGIEGHGPQGEGLDSSDFINDKHHVPKPGRNRGPLRAAAEAILAELERILHVYVARLQSDPAIPSARRVTEAQVEDQLASFLADLAGVLHQLEERELPDGEEAQAGVRDATAIQMVVAERHGAQRARLGWSEVEIQREFAILREELNSAVRRRAPDFLAGPDGADVTEAGLKVLGEFLEITEGLSISSFRRSAAENEAKV